MLQRKHDLDQPATPAAASRWPMLVLTEPITSGRLARLAQHVAERLHLDGIAERRAGAVRLDVADVARLDAARRPAHARITASCAGPFGRRQAVLRPSWLTAVPRITARTRSPSACASDSRFSTTTPQPSPRT